MVEPMTTQRDLKKVLLWVLAIVVIGGASVFAASINLSECEAQWEENRATAESEYMTRDRYISNCEANRDFHTNNRDLFED